ncbi:MAG: holo-ACP synthase [Microthrixaceae bacterium]
MIEAPAGSVIGTDIVEVDDMRRALERQPGLRTRIFTEAEWDYAANFADPLPHLAARFAAKEAVMKALGRGMDSMSFTDIEVIKDAHGAPGVVLRGRALDLARSKGDIRWSISLTHTRSIAHAVALATTVPA